MKVLDTKENIEIEFLDIPCDEVAEEVEYDVRRYQCLNCKGEIRFYRHGSDYVNWYCDCPR